MAIEISLREALIKFYKDKNINIEFSYNYRIKAAGVHYKKYEKYIIKYFFVVPEENRDDISLINDVYDVFSPSNIALVSIGERRHDIHEVAEFYFEDRNRDYMKFNNPLSKKNRKLDRVKLNKNKKYHWWKLRGYKCVNKE